MEYRKGPWHRVGRYVKAPDGGFLAKCYASDEVHANAQLMTLAPEMYEALQSISDSGFSGKEITEIRAIAKYLVEKANSLE